MKSPSGGKSRARITRRLPSRPMAIDFHAHFVLPEAAAFARPYKVTAANTQTPDDPRITKKARAEAAKKWGDVTRQRMQDFKVRLKVMDRAGIDIQVLSASLIVQYTYWAEPESSLRIERKSNDLLAEIIATAPHRFVGLGGMPLQSPELAITEMERCIGDLGFKGIQVSGSAGHMELGDARLRPFWSRAEQLGAMIYIHPAGVPEPRYQKHQLWNSLGQPQEEAMAMMSLIYDGIIDDYPKLKICIAHGGGYLPFYAGRVDRNYLDKPQMRYGQERTPSQYMKKSFYYDSCVYDRDMFDFLVKKVGARRIVLGSDYPVGEKDPVRFVTRSRVLSAADKERILSKNAARLLGLRL